MRFFLITRCKKCIFFILLLLLLLLHFIIIPSASGSYHAQCYLDKTSKGQLTFILENLIRVFEKHGVYYWLDYGTLLGAVRNHGIIPWDGDGDVSILRMDPNIYNALDEINTVQAGLRCNTMVCNYGNMTVDIVRWSKLNASDSGMTSLVKYYPKWNKDNFIVTTYRRFESIPLNFIGERTKIKFLNGEASVPFEYHKLLKYRYPFTYWVKIPYKWKCYFKGLF